MPKKKQEEEEFGSFDDLLGMLASGLQSKLPNHLQYDPHEKQIKFHSSQAKFRQFLGGNRSGKTVAGINEDIFWALGDHPYITMPKAPIRGRIVTVDFKNGAHKIIIPQLKQWLPPSSLINGSWEDSYNANLNELTLSNKSVIEIMSHEQDLDKFAGVPLHWVHYDEEPPMDIFKECEARLADYNGRHWMTMTPIEGMTWTFDDIYEKRNSSELIEVIEVHQDDNPHLSREGRESLQAGMSDEEYEVRAEGKYIAISGLVFKSYDSEKHTRPAFIPDRDNWVHYESLDHGFANPTAYIWHAVHKTTGLVVTYFEHYKSEWTVSQHAELILATRKKMLNEYGIKPYMSIADPAIKQRSAITGLSIQVEYSQLGIYWALGKEKNVDAGLDKMNDYLRTIRWIITDDCPFLQKEMRGYKRGQFATQRLRDKNNRKEEPQKKNDHAIDSSRYFFSFMPELNVAELEKRGTVEAPNLMGAPTRRLDGRVGTFDTNLRRKPSVVKDYDEFVGEY